MGNKQTNKILQMIKSLSVLDTYSSAACTKSSKFEKVIIVQTRDDLKNGEFFLFCTKLLFFGKK